MISAYAKPGYIDHAVLSTDSYATFIENVFLNGERLDPTALGNPDNRPDIRDALTSVTFLDGTTAPIGNLMDEFDFRERALPPLVLSTRMPNHIVIHCGSKTKDFPQDCGGREVRVFWDKVTGPHIPGPFTYQVQRDGTPLTTCDSSATSCVDRHVSPGTHIYTVSSIDQNGVVSPPSAGAEADVPDMQE
jgi:hypothetical protein